MPLKVMKMPGFDLGSEGLRRKALEEAALTGLLQQQSLSPLLMRRGPKGILNLSPCV
jgi:CHASE1-domain containing sensor protein